MEREQIIQALADLLIESGRDLVKDHNSNCSDPMQRISLREHMEHIVEQDVLNLGFVEEVYAAIHKVFDHQPAIPNPRQFAFFDVRTERATSKPMSLQKVLRETDWIDEDVEHLIALQPMEKYVPPCGDNSSEGFGVMRLA